MADRPRGVLPHGLTTDKPVAASSNASATALPISNCIPTGSACPTMIPWSLGSITTNPVAVNTPAIPHLMMTHQ